MIDFSTITPSIPFILEGALVTLKFTVFSLLCGLPLGIFLGISSITNNKFLRYFANTYVSIFRGTPLLVQLLLIYNAIPQLTGYSMTAFEAGILTFSLNSAAYTSQSIRAGIQSIDIGQWEAAQILGLSYKTTLFKIIMPQAIRNIFPALLNEMVNLLKESALVSIIGEADLMRRGQMIASQTYTFFEPYVVVALCYFVLVFMMTTLANHVEKRFSLAR